MDCSGPVAPLRRSDQQDPSTEDDGTNELVEPAPNRDPYDKPEYELPQPLPFPDTSWQVDGECGAVDADGNPVYEADDFFLENRYAPNSREYRAAAAKARAACSDCMVRGRCLQFAIDNNIQIGIWGGETYWQRKARKYPRHRVDGRLVYDSRRGES